MSVQPAYVVTKAGLALFTKLAARGMPLSITQIMFGTGKVPEGTTAQELMERTELVAPFVQGTSTTPIYQGNTLSLVVEYRSDLDKTIKEAFWLNEFGIMMADPDVGSILAIYGTLGDYPDSVLPYEEGQEITVRDYPISVTVSGAEKVIIEYSASAYITSEDAAALINAAISAAISLTMGVTLARVTIAPEAWQKDETATGRYTYFADAPVEGATVTEAHLPDVILDNNSLDAAAACGIAPKVDTTEDGRLRFYSQVAPGTAITGVVRLWAPGDGTAHAYAEVSPEHMAQEEDVGEMLDEVFGNDSATGAQ